MLSEDITGALGKGMHMVGRVIGGAIKGLILGALIVFAIGALWPAAAGGIAAFSASAGFMGVLSAIGHGLLTGAAAMVGLGAPIVATAGSMSVVLGPHLLLLGAEIGAAVLGVTSIIPSVKTWPGHVQNAVHKSRNAVEYSKDIAHTVSPPQPEMDNPNYEPGKGAQAMAKGDNAQGAAGVAR